MRYEIRNVRTSALLAGDAWIAESAWQRMKGLLGRTSLAEGEALLIRPCSSIHTFFMRMDLDVIFLDRTGRVIKVARDVAPWHLVFASKARDTIEMAGGALADADLQPGDELTIEPRSRS